MSETDWSRCHKPEKRIIGGIIGGICMKWGLLALGGKCSVDHEPCLAIVEEVADD